MNEKVIKVPCIDLMHQTIASSSSSQLRIECCREIIAGFLIVLVVVAEVAFVEVADADFNAVVVIVIVVDCSEVETTALEDD